MCGAWVFKEQIMETNYIQEDTPGGVPVKMWMRGVPIEDEARRQLTNAARLATADAVTRVR